MTHPPRCCSKCARAFHDKREAEGADRPELINILSFFFRCRECGNKRCPKGTDHTLTCTDSNEPGQPGSRYQ